MSKATVSNGTSNTGIVNRIGARVVQKMLSFDKIAAFDFAELISSRSRAKLLRRTAEKGFSVARSFVTARQFWLECPVLLDSHLLVELNSVLRIAYQGQQCAEQPMKSKSSGIRRIVCHVWHDQLQTCEHRDTSGLMNAYLEKHCNVLHVCRYPMTLHLLSDVPCPHVSGVFRDAVQCGSQDR